MIDSLMDGGPPEYIHSERAWRHPYGVALWRKSSFSLITSLMILSVAISAKSIGRVVARSDRAAHARHLLVFLFFIFFF
jgi:hypothetical protein